MPGDPGPNFFDIFIDDFFMIEGGPTGALSFNVVKIVEPIISPRNPSSGAAGGAVAFRDLFIGSPADSKGLV